MKDFENLLPTRNSKKISKKSFAELVYNAAINSGVVAKDDFEHFEELCMDKSKILMDKNKKCRPDLILLWSLLDMRKYLEAISEQTINPYIGNLPVKDLDYYPLVEAKYHNLLDIKYIRKIKFYDITFKNVFIVTYEIYDEYNRIFRPYVEIYTKDDKGFKVIADGGFKKVATGYDTTNNKSVELYFSYFNYAVYLSPSGTIELPLKNKKIRLFIDSVLTYEDMNKLLYDVYIEDLEIDK